MPTETTNQKVYTWTEINQMPTLDPKGNLEFQRLISAMANGLRISERVTK